MLRGCSRQRTSATPAPAIISNDASCTAVGRSSASLQTHPSSSKLKARLHLPASASVGGGAVEMRKSARIGGCSLPR